MYGKHPKNWDGKKWLDPPTVDCSKDSPVTVQSSGIEVDINKIVKRIEKGMPVPVLNGEPFYGDVSGFSGLQDAIIKVQDAEDVFMQFPADIRERFENDPVKFVEFLDDDKNRDEAIKLGIIPPPPPQPAPDKPA